MFSILWKHNRLYPGPLLPPTSWWSPIVCCQCNRKKVKNLVDALHQRKCPSLCSSSFIGNSKFPVNSLFRFVRFQRLWHSFERKKIADSSSRPFRCRPDPGPQHPAGAGRGAPDVAATLGHQGSLSVNSTVADFNFKALRLETGCDKNEIAGIERFFLFSFKKLVSWIGCFSQFQSDPQLR